MSFDATADLTLNFCNSNWFVKDSCTLFLIISVPVPISLALSSKP